MWKFPSYKQFDRMDCGPVCLKIIAKHYGRTFSVQRLREKCFVTREGASLLDISEAAENIGFKTIAARLTFEQIRDEAFTPFIVHWRQNHYVVVYKIKDNKVYVSDPATGLVGYTQDEFLNGWSSSGKDGVRTGIVLLMEPTAQFFQDEDEPPADHDFGVLFNYMRPYRRYLLQILLGMVGVTLIQFVFPFLTQSIVDVGIKNQNLNFITLVLIGQLVLFISRTSIEFIRSWILLHIGIRVNISLISDFLIKMMRLPLAFFDSRNVGDLLQRIDDHKRIEALLTSSTLGSLFSVVNIIVFGTILAFYDLVIFLVFILGSLAYIAWIVLFMQKRRELDFKRFDQMSTNQSNLVNLIQGIQEIKLHNSEKIKRWEWERVQTKLSKTRIRSLALNQVQQAGSFFINELKNIIITVLAAKAVITGNVTLGMMLAIQYIIGQLNAPISQLIQFAHSLQDARMSLERMGELHHMKEEEERKAHRTTVFSLNQSISLHNVCFQYNGPNSEVVLNNINCTIPEGKITAIVGASGSGKTTLIKLLLKFYEPVQGSIKFGDLDFADISNKAWRNACGAVLQDGFIFSDTVARNVAVSEDYVDKEKLKQALRLANIDDFVEGLPLGYHTRIGTNGMGLSQGQKQRLLIARAVYKNPRFLFFDEATNALDANNERIIMNNLLNFFIGRTVIIIAHRLSTVTGADQIIFMKHGKISEVGDHQTLTEKRGDYYHLVKNQLELGLT